MKKLSEDSQIKEVLIQETWRKIKGRVYWYWRFNGHGKWNRQLTSYKEVPYIKVNWGEFSVQDYKKL